MSQEPLVSVVVPVLNRANQIGQTLDSILAQDYPAIECLVVDGGSTDGTIEKVKAIGPPVSIVSRPDSGPFDAINDGWSKANGSIVTWLNADDIWAPGAVRAAVAFLQEHPEIDLVYGACGGVDERGRRLWLESPRRWDLTRAIVRCDPIIHQPASFMRKAIVERVAGVYPDWCHDHDLWIRIGLAGGRFGMIDRHLADCRVWAGDANKNPELIQPAVMRLVDRTFANPLLPAEIAGMKRRAVSFAFARCIKYLWLENPAHWLQAAKLAAQAVIAQPSNLPGIAAEIAGLGVPLTRTLLGRTRLLLARTR